MPSRTEIITFDDAPPPPGAQAWVSPAARGTGIEMTEPDPAWPVHYAELALRIREALGWRALQLEHVGSTSVPGLPAKPIIDIDLLVADPDREQDYVPALETAGFTLVIREPWWYGHRSLTADEPPRCNLHVFGFDSPEPVRHRIFRDWLRGNPAERDLYADIKRKAAAEANAEGEHVMQYNARKQQVIREIYQRAFAAAGLLLPVAEAVEEAAEDAAVAGERGSRRRGGALGRDGLVVVGAGDGVDDLVFVEVLRAFDRGHEPHEHAVLHHLRLKTGRAVVIPFGLAPAGQRDPDAEIDGPAEQVRIHAAVAERVNHPAGLELVHAGSVVLVSERSLNTGSV